MPTPPTASAPPARRPWRLATLALAVLALLAVLVGAASWLLGPADDDGPAAVVAPGTGGPTWFRDVTAASGVAFTYRNGADADHRTILESLGGGVALLDYDGDGRLDLFFPGGGAFDRPRADYPADPAAYAEAVRRSPPGLQGAACKLYRNLGGWRFRDVTAEAGLDRPGFYSHGAAVADFDRDGWSDLLVTGYGGLTLWHNESDGRGGRRFVDVTDRLGVAAPGWCTSAGWADLDGDGWPDLYVCRYVDWSFANHPLCPGYVPGVDRDVCGPERFRPLRHLLLHNDHGQAFRDVSAEQGFRAAGCGLGVVLADLNGDGRPDVYVANDTSGNFLFFNRGGQLDEQGLAAGAAVDDRARANGSMGVDAGDYDGSGRPSLFVTNFQGETHALYRNLGGELFQFQTRPAGIAAIGQHFVGFGTGFVDVDNDGWEDLVIANGHVFQHPGGGSTVRQRPVLLHNVASAGQRFFTDAAARGGPFFAVPAVGRGLAVGDLDNDGWPDLVFSPINRPAVLLRNEAMQAGAAHWLGVRLVGRDHRDVVGSTVVLEAGGRRLTRFAKGGGSYLSARDPRILFGLGSVGSPCRVTVRWSWGQVQTWDGLTPDRYWELHEAEPQARPVAAARP